MAWYDEFFDEYYNKTYGHLDRERSVIEADFIEKIMELTPEDKILDVPCGYGRHSTELALRGYNVTGIEYNPAQINKAKEYMKNYGAQFEIIQGDMRKIPFENRYDKLFNYFTSIGYFDEEDNEATLASFNKALKKGGLFLIETINRDFIIKEYVSHNITRREDGCLFLEERKFDPISGRMFCVHTFIEKDGSRVERSLDHRLYAPNEL